MAIRNIVKEGDDVLRKRSKEVKEINDKIRELFEDMKETLYACGNGIGLAAPQVGILKRMIVIDLGDGPMEIINPVIVEQEGEQIEIEGCLSIPGVYGEVKRPARVVVEYTNLNGEKVRVEGTELLARCLSHEIDHLDGILFTDKVIRYVDVEEEK
ncbi:MAG TPA: peptide deformylase [Thermoclostridium caenicola]|uniref:Peptide deformylase n=1 Tax=Thermoclostridium caenicola TaxID=659425 RepID=A0A1M6IPV8_9FIRM|nr:peptide deformylase [Thermoclostridium caenicola]HPU45867.1 peptide deformylase [Thermoclostridium sp.]SHJ36506.1 peptide deformylase [Thermoclostridium caenicola]HOK43937.1 peptide deformylase [Thermoclostridium caenicola]HOL83861.1 peptide deformylase [Thermoclostridium caenicola]HOP73174.1 peptide deformylase [Thermoclostridium caenicola]